MTDLKKYKLKKDEYPFLCVYKNDGTIFGGKNFNKTQWKKEYEKFYNALVKDNCSYKLVLFITQDKKTQYPLKVENILFTDIINN